MADGTTKAIETLRIGDLTAGGRVTGVMQYEPVDFMYTYNGVVITGNHAVWEDGEWKRVAASNKAEQLPGVKDGQALYCIRTVKHVVFAGSPVTVFVDELEVDGAAMGAMHKLSLAELNRAARHSGPCQPLRLESSTLA